MKSKNPTKTEIVFADLERLFKSIYNQDNQGPIKQRMIRSKHTGRREGEPAVRKHVQLFGV